MLQGTWQLFGTELRNRNYLTLPGNWVLPSQGSIGNIENIDRGMVLSVVSDGITDETEVMLKKAVPNDIGQEWEIQFKCFADTDHIYIKNCASKKRLMAFSEDKLTTTDGM